MSREHKYQWAVNQSIEHSKKDIATWSSKFGPLVTGRKRNKEAKRVLFQVFLDNKDLEVYLVGDFNNWDTNVKNLSKYKLKKDSHGLFASIELDTIVHKDAYKFLLVNGNETALVQDPAGVYFNDDGNSIFWDYDDPSSYTQKYDFLDTRNRSTKILQTDLPGLVTHWANKRGKLGWEFHEKEMYSFIAKSGVVKHIKELGFNTIQFLPFAQSIDGSNWKFRYLVPFQFAIQKNWGTPDEFSRMIDEFHKQGIAVIGDFVVGHMPFKDYEIFGQSSRDNGIHPWKKSDGRGLYLEEETSWGTKRPDTDNPYVREFLVSSVLHFMKAYKIDGMRIDNVDGILRYGEAGDGPERPNGRTFLRELNQTVYDYNPRALVHFEAHYFHEDNAKLLVTPFDDSPRSLGATAYNESRVSHYLHKEYMPKAVSKVSVWKFKDIVDEKEWGQSNSTIADFHNHDAAAGLMDMRCTGSYAYDTMTQKQPHNHIHALGKIKVMEALISFIQEGRTLDLLQSLLLQTGTFEHDSSIHWQMTFVEVSKNTLAYKQKVNEIMDAPPFWPRYIDGRSFLNLDEKNKVIIVERYAKHENKEYRYVIVINISSWKHNNYKVGVKTDSDYQVVLNSDEFRFAGLGLANLGERVLNQESTNFELLDRELELSVLAPYGVVVLREVKK